MSPKHSVCHTNECSQAVTSVGFRAPNCSLRTGAIDNEPGRIDGERAGRSGLTAQALTDSQKMISSVDDSAIVIPITVLSPYTIKKRSLIALFHLSVCPHRVGYQLPTATSFRPLPSARRSLKRQLFSLSPRPVLSRGDVHHFIAILFHLTVVGVVLMIDRSNRYNLHTRRNKASLLSARASERASTPAFPPLTNTTILLDKSQKPVRGLQSKSWERRWNTTPRSRRWMQKLVWTPKLNSCGLSDQLKLPFAVP
ncbi:hypothetical protein GGI35DRAFT_240017 [Trichoderma velutinum]